MTTAYRPPQTWSIRIPALEGQYDGHVEAALWGPAVGLTLQTFNPNYGGESDLGTFAVETLDALDGLWPFEAGELDELRHAARAVIPGPADEWPLMVTRVVREVPHVDAALATIADALAGVGAGLSARDRGCDDWADAEERRGKAATIAAWATAPVTLAQLCGELAPVLARGELDWSSWDARERRVRAILARWRAVRADAVKTPI